MTAPIRIDAMEQKTSRAAFGFALVATVVAGLMLGVSVGAPAMVERAAVRAIGAVEKRLGVRLDADTVEWGWGGATTASNVVVRDASGALLATVALMTIDARADLLGRKVAVAAVTLDGVAVALKLNADGTTNLDGILSALRGSDEVADSGALPGGRFLVNRAPRIVVRDLRVVLDTAIRGLPFGLEIPTRVGLSGGTFTAIPGALAEGSPGLREAIWDISLAFEDMTLDPGFGAALTLRAGLDAGLEEVGFDFRRPVRVAIGSRLAAIGGFAWSRAGATVEIRNLQLSQAVGSDVNATVSAAISVPSLQIAPVDAAALVKAGARGDTAGLFKSLTAQLLEHGRFTLDSPVVAVAIDEHGVHSFQDILLLLKTKAAIVAPSTDQPSTARISKGASAAAPQDAIKGIVTAGFQALDAKATRLLAKAIGLSGVDGGPWPTLVVNHGRFFVTAAGQALRFEDVALSVSQDGEARQAAFEADLHAGGVAEPGHIKASFGRALPEAPDDIRVSLEATRLPLSLVASMRSAESKVGFSRSASLSGLHLSLVGPVAGGPWVAEAKVAFAGLTLNLSALAAKPLQDLDGEVGARIAWNPADGLLRVDQIALRRGDVVVTGELDIIDPMKSPRLKLALALERVDVQSVFAAVPPEVVPALEGLRMTGTLAWDLVIDLDTERVESIEIDSRPSLSSFAVTTLGKHIDFEKLYAAIPYEILLSDGTPGTRFVGPTTGSWVPLQRIAPWLPLALTTTEDGTFERHDGISTMAIKESIITNLKRGGFVRGGSTITQQLVKNLYLGSSKHIGRKLQELFIAWRLTQFLPKDRVMELYLNTIEFGPGIYGIGDAAYHWFGKRAADLDLGECIFLASIIPSPRRYHSFFQAGAITPRWRSYLEMLLGVMVKRGKITAEDVAATAPVAPRFRGVQGGGGGAVFDAPPDREKPDDEDPMDTPIGREDRDVEPWDGDIRDAP